MVPNRDHNAGDPPASRVSRKDFVRLCAASGAGFAAFPLLSACGRTADVEPGGGEPVSGGPEVGSEEAIAEDSAVRPGTAVPFTDAGSGEQAVLLRSEEGRISAYSAVCTHQGCIVAYDAEERTLECSCHGSVFDAESGAEVLRGPAPRPLPGIPVRIEGGMVVRV